MNLFLLASEAAHEPNSYILPSDIDEVIWGTIAFLIVAFLIIWKGGPAIKGMWNGRIERIRSEVDGAAEARAASEAKLAAVEADLADAETERQRILSEGRETADAVKQQIIAKAGSDAADARARGAADAESSKAQATSDLQAEISILALGAAEQVVGNSLDDATQTELIENYINRVGAGS